MKKEDLLKLARNPAFIPGIYEYCDRWCERCAFTSRCMNFAIEQAEARGLRNEGESHGAFWSRLETSLRQTNDLLKEVAAEYGVHHDSGDPAPREAPAKDQVERPHPLAAAAGDYVNLVDEWFQSNEDALRAKEEEVLVQAQLGVAGLNDQIASLTDAVQILRWDQHVIPIKLARGTARPLNAPSAGHVKVALLGIDRSIAAWLRLKEFFPESTDSILTILVHLDRLRHSAKAEFPEARAFVRPGFDTNG